MSRFSDDYDGDNWYPNAADLWHANAKRAIEGKRGQKALRELREALLALPERRLIGGALCTVGAEQRLERNLDLESTDYGKKYLQSEWDEWIEPQGEGVCAIGAYLWHKKVKAGMEPQAAFDDLPTVLGYEGDGGLRTAEMGRDAGLTFTLAWSLASRNDQLMEAATPEERFESFLAWIDAQLKPETVAA